MPRTPSLRLDGKVALVTGGNSGIGLGMAHALAAAGADVGIWGTNGDKNREAEKALAVHGRRIVALRCDVGEEEQVEGAFGETLRALGRIDACFANAAVGGTPREFIALATEEWRRVLRVNLDGVFFTLRAAARHMVERGGGGSLVGTSSLAALDGTPRFEHYAASKGAMISVLKALAVELARYEIRANVIIPGWIETPMTEGRLDHDVMRERVLRRIPIRRWGTPEDFGGIAVYLASDASRYHTGDTFVVDGGYAVF